jgi:HTH-type transcriptional repressor of NAD biosynthesis genes
MKKLNIVFMGAPSSGKTTLCKALATHFEEPWMFEFGKQYWIEHQVDRRLSQEQLHEIALLHLNEENQRLSEAKNVLFTDTNAITTYMFALDYYGHVDEDLTKLAQQAEHRYDHFFVCDIDIPYEDTWERSGLVYRERFQKMILEDLRRRSVNFTLLSGTLKERFDKVCSVILS